MRNYIFINGKKTTTSGKTLAQLEHLLFLSEIEIANYEKTIKNYPVERMDRFGIPHLTKLQAVSQTIRTAIGIFKQP